MGFSATGGEFCKRGDIALDGISNCMKVVDDFLTWDSSCSEHLLLLKRYRDHGPAMNYDKFVFARRAVEYCGYMVSTDDVAASPAVVNGITDFPTPCNITDLRSFLGLVKKLPDFSPDIADLLSSKNEFLCIPDHQ